MKLIFYGALVLTCLAVGVSSLKCYICDSVSQKGCDHGSAVDNDYILDCDGGMGQLTPPENMTYTICRKIVTTIDFDVNSNKKGERINRVCGWEKSKYDNDCYYRGGLGGRTTVCSCTTDKCNGASTFGAAALTTTIIVPSVYLLAKALSS